jgi:hypothetical protein
MADGRRMRRYEPPGLRKLRRTVPIANGELAFLSPVRARCNGVSLACFCSFNSWSASYWPGTMRAKELRFFNAETQWPRRNNDFQRRDAAAAEELRFFNAETRRPQREHRHLCMAGPTGGVMNRRATDMVEA